MRVSLLPAAPPLIFNASSTCCTPQLVVTCQQVSACSAPAATFSKHYASRTALAARPDLGEGGNRRPVVDLLVEQIECADFVLLNKTDMLEPGQVGSLQDIASSLNPLAKVS